MIRNPNKILIIKLLIFSCLITNSAYSQTPWYTTGNTLLGTEKLGGSSGNFPLDFYINNAKKMSLTTGGDLDITNSNDGYSIAGQLVVMRNNTSIFIGYGAGQLANTSNNSTFVGTDAGSGNTINNVLNASSGNVALGYRAGKYLKTGDYNTFTGFTSGFSDSTGAKNVFCGYSSGYFNNGDFNIGIGASALYTNSTGTKNTSVGASSAYSNTSGTNNNAFGYQSLYTNSSGNYNSAFGDYALFTNTADKNVAYGYEALYSNSTGTPNAAFGYQALKANTNGYSNSAFGYQALSANNTGYLNSAFGKSAMAANTNGISNCAFGFESMDANTSGSNNNAYGNHALGQNISGSANTAVGFGAIYTNTVTSYNSALGYQALYYGLSEKNTAIGYKALFNITTGSSNTAVGFSAAASYSTTTSGTFVGHAADVNGAGYTNSGAFGHGAISTGSNIVYIGNASCSTYCALGVWSGSDGRFKTDVQENVPGLNFIKKLRPVTYKFDTKRLTEHIVQNMPDSVKTTYIDGTDFTNSSDVVRSGFIAQEVEAALNETNYLSDIVQVPQNNAGHYVLNYAEFVVPLVKAVQEQQLIIDSLKTKNTKQDSINHALQNQINEIVNNCCNAGNRVGQTGNEGENKNVDATEVQLSDKNSVVLMQNIPNPFAEQTTISYNIPDNFTSAQILFYNNAGRLIKTVDIKTKGEGKLNVFANDLTNGIYTYTLIIDSKIIDTKKMIKTQ